VEAYLEKVKAETDADRKEMKSWLDETKASLEKWGVNPEDEFCSGA
jgi:hypothetical protein